MLCRSFSWKGKVGRNEREAIPVYAGEIWKRSVESFFDGFSDSVFFDFPVWGKNLLYNRNCAFSVCVF